MGKPGPFSGTFTATQCLRGTRKAQPALSVKLIEATRNAGRWGSAVYSPGQARKPGFFPNIGPSIATLSAMLHFPTRCFLPVMLWLLLLTLPAKAQPVPAAEVDSLRKALAQTQTDTNQVKLWVRLGEFQVYKPGEFPADLDSARTYAEQARRLSRKLGYYQGEARSLNLLGTTSKELQDVPGAVAYHRAAIALLEHHRDWRGVAGSLVLLAEAWCQKRDLAQARKNAQTAIHLATRKGYLQQAAEACIGMGNTYDYHGEGLKVKMQYYQQALQLFTKAGNRRKQADVLKSIGDIYNFGGNKAQALIELRKALALYRSINHPELHELYDLMGNISARMGDYQEGLKYGLQAVMIAESLKDTTMAMCTIYNRLGITYSLLKQYQKALFYFNKALPVAQKYNDRSSIPRIINNISDVLLRSLHQPEEALKLLRQTVRTYAPLNTNDSTMYTYNFLGSYTELKRYDLAQRYCNQLLALSDQLGKNDSHQRFVFPGVIPFFLASKQLEQARHYLSEYELFCKNSRDLKEASWVQLMWFRLDSLQGKYASAIQHYQRYKQLEDSLYNETKSKYLASLEVISETEKKEQDIKLKEQSIKALTRERLLQAQQIRQDQFLRNGIIGGAVLLLLLLGVIYNRYRLKRRSNQQLWVQQQKLQAQHEELQAQQREINHKNEHLSQLLAEKDALLVLQNTLLGDKEALLKEKDSLLTGQERLLKEIHHRVKNNLQIVMSLLSSQADSLEDKAALSAIQESQHRVQAMALIHQKLYQAEGVARIPMRDYIEEVVAYLSDYYNLSQPIAFHLSVDDIELDVSQAVPLGLIINEAMTNAFKYAFPGGRAGTVRLSLHRRAAASCELTIADDGVGLPQHYDPSLSRSLGMTLLHGFSQQLGGQLTITSPPGMRVRLVFDNEQLGLVHAAAYA